MRGESLCLARAAWSESSAPNWFCFKSMQQFVYLGRRSFSKQTSTKFAQEKRTYVWGRDVTSGEEEKPGSLQCRERGLRFAPG